MYQLSGTDAGLNGGGVVGTLAVELLFHRPQPLVYGIQPAAASHFSLTRCQVLARKVMPPAHWSNALAATTRRAEFSATSLDAAARAGSRLRKLRLRV